MTLLQPMLSRLHSESRVQEDLWPNPPGLALLAHPSSLPDGSFSLSLTLLQTDGLVN